MGWTLVIASPMILIFGGGFLISLGLKDWAGIPLGFLIAFAVGFCGIPIARTRV